MLRLTLKMLGHYVWILDKLQFTHTIQHRHILVLHGRNNKTESLKSSTHSEMRHTPNANASPRLGRVAPKLGRAWCQYQMRKTRYKAFELCSALYEKAWPFVIKRQILKCNRPRLIFMFY